MKKEDFEIKIHHVGGIEGFGPIDVMEFITDGVKWIVYDAEEDALKNTDTKNKNIKLVNKCLSNYDGKAKFNIFKTVSANSLYLSDEKADNWSMSGLNKTWGSDTELIRKVDAEVNKLDTLIERKETENIDILSVDAQGADLDIIKGALKNIKSIIAITCEVEFARLYKDQPLFYDVHKFMDENHFRLCEIVSQQFFNLKPYPKPFRGKGFYTVGEALFIKDYLYLLNNLPLEKAVSQCIKLAVFGLATNQCDLTLEILKELENRGIDIEKLSEDNYNYVKGLSNFFKLYKSSFG